MSDFRFGFAILLLCAAPVFAPADDGASWNEQALTALEQGKSKEEILPLLRKGIEAGETDAMVNYAFFAAHGEAGLKKDETEAVRLFRLAAEKGNEVAKMYLGAAYLSGRGIEKNEEEGLRMLRSAAASGLPAAHYLLGLHAEGNRDYAQAASCYRAAGNDHPESLNRLGLLAYFGLGEKPSDTDALAFFLRAGKMGNASALNNAAFVLTHRFEEKPDWDAAIPLYEKAASLGCAAAHCNLGSLYSGGAGAERLDPVRAAHHWEEAARSGRADAVYQLAMAYRDGNGVMQDRKKAFDLCRQAAEKKNSFACWQLAEMLEKGIGTEKDPAAAEEWRKRSRLPLPDADAARKADALAEPAAGLRKE